MVSIYYLSFAEEEGKKTEQKMAAKSNDPCQICDRFFTFLFTSLIGFFTWFFKGTLDGNSPFSLLAFPIVLLWHSIFIYALPTVGIYVKRAYRVFLSFLCKPFGGYVLDDSPHFHTTALVLGKYKEKDGEESLKELFDEQGCKTYEEWHKTIELVRFKDLGPIGSKKVSEEDNNTFLFKNGIDPSDIGQGSLGDCWLLAAIACLAEHPDALRKLFIDREINPRGYYKLRLFHAAREKWVTVGVDDRFPVKVATTKLLKEKKLLFLRETDNELWVCLLQKAFAKIFGGYAQLDGGHSVVAWSFLTGGNCMILKREANETVWDKTEFTFGSEKSFKDSYCIRVGRSSVFYRPTSDPEFKKKTEDQVFDILRAYAKARCLLGASVNKRDDEEVEAKRETGLIAQHAYSILECRRPGMKSMDKVYDKGKTGVKLVKLRNPWGDEHEWKGAWSDGSKEWTENPTFAEELNYVPKANDGVFWMEWSDFNENFTKIQICDRDANKDLSLEIFETHPKCGPCLGCAFGCASFWCKCNGCRVIYFGNEKGDAMKSGAGCTKICTAV